MKLKFRKIENTSWITNFFVTDNSLYLTDSEISKNNNLLCKIDLPILRENLKIKGNLDRTFLAHPNPIISSLNLSSQTDVEIVYSSDLYIQNFITIEEVSYISFVKNQKVYTSIFQENLDLKEFQIITKLKENKLVIKLDKQFWIVDKNLKKLQLINFELNNIVEFENFYVIHYKDEKIAIHNKNFKFVKYLSEDYNFKKIFYLNKNNVLISFKDQSKTILINILNKNELLFDKSFFYRGQLLEENLLLVKKEDNISFDNLLNFIS